MRRSNLGAWFLAVAAVVAALFVSGRRGPPAEAGPPLGKGVLAGVIEDEAQKPVGGAEVSVEVKGKTVHTALTDAQGAFQITGMPTGDVVVRVRRAGYLTYGESLVVAGKGTTRMRATLKPGVLYAGRVADARGAPVAEADVYVVARSKEEVKFPTDLEAVPHGHARTAADGTFRLVVPPGKGYALRVLHPRHERAELGGLPCEATTVKEDVAVTLLDAAWVTGTVLDAAGKPVAGARVGGAPDFVWPLDLASLFEEGTAGVRLLVLNQSGTTTDAKGRFTIGGFTEPTAQVTIDHPDFHFLEVPLEALERGRERALAEVRLERAQGTVEGSVVDAKGKPVRDAWVGYEGEHGTVEATTDAAGRFRLSKMRAKGAVAVDVSAAGCADEHVEAVPVGSKSLKVTLRPAPRWKALVTDGQGNLVKRLFVSVERKDGLWRAARKRDLQFTSVEQTAAGVEVELPVKQAQVTLQAQGFARKTIGPFETQPGQVVDAGTVALEKAAR